MRVELDHNSNLELERARSRARAGERSETPDDPVLTSYFRALNDCPLLERAVEQRYAEQLQQAREAMASLLLELPERHRKLVLNGDAEAAPNARSWRLSRLEACYRKMLLLLTGVDEPSVSSIVERARPLKRRLDGARDALVMSNLRFVAYLARQLSADRSSYLDLIQEGNLGLLEAVERFEYHRGFRFSTYAYWWIRRAMLLARAGKSRLIYLPAHVHERAGQMNRVTSELSDALGRSPTVEEIAREMNLPRSKVEHLIRLMLAPQPLDLPDRQRAETLAPANPPDSAGTSPLEAALEGEIRDQMQSALRRLSPQEQRIIRLRFGIGRPRRHTLKEIGKALGLSRERVRQIERRALRRLLDTPQARSLGPRR